MPLEYHDIELRGPFRILSTAAIDGPVLDVIAPGERETLRYAAGVCTDARKYCVGALSIVDRFGNVADSDVWGPAVKAARNTNNARK